MKTRIQPNFVLHIIILLFLLPACNFLQRSLATPGETAQPQFPLTPIPFATPLSPTEMPSAIALFPTSTTQIIPTQTITQSQPATVAPQSGERYAVVDVAPDDVLNVRSEPGIANPILGVIPPFGTGVEITGPGIKIDDGAYWAPVSYEDLKGWVNTRYLAVQVGSSNPAVTNRANQIIQAIKAKDMQALTAFIHPEEGVRFSPYAYVRDQDLVFSQNQVNQLNIDPTIYVWGVFDGSGEPIQMTFWEYYERFIYDRDFAKPQQIGFNQIIGQGNTINNLAEYYPGAEFIEYHFAGTDPQYEGLDWRSLRIVLEQKSGIWYLIGVIHDEWTI